MSPPLLAITMGDPAGVGPETIVGAWRSADLHARCRPLVVGHPDVLRRAVELLRQPIEIVSIDSPEQARPSPTALPCLAACGDAARAVPPATVDARGGQAAYEALVAAARLALAGQVQAVVTAPLHKAALWQAGHRYPGHTELLAELCGVHEYAMMLYLPPCEVVRSPAGLGIVHVTLHMALRDVFAHITPTNVLEKIRLVNTAMQRLGAPQPRIGVCALNPHAGEEGLFGDEETTQIRPAVAAALAEVLMASGPLPADTLIARAQGGEFDAVVAMYHDQGHIAMKLLAMHRAVNITLGLPIVRTSVAHGTAFDRAWQGQAETTGLVQAIRVAARLAIAKTPKTISAKSGANTP